MTRSARAFLTSVAVSSLGDGFRYAALPLLLALNGSSPFLLGLLLAVGTAPFLLVGVVGGAFVDRYDRVLVLRIADLSRFVVGAAFVALLTIPAERNVIVVCAFVVAFVMGVGEAFSYPAIFSITPALVDAEGLARFNGRINAAETLGRNLIGPLIGAAAVGSFSPAPFVVDALTFAASWLLLSRVAVRRDTETLVRKDIRSEIADGIRWLRTKPVLITLTIASALINLGNMGFLATQAAYAVRTLHSPAIGYGVLMTAAAIGGTVASLTIDRFMRRGSSLRVVPLACLVVAVGMVLVAVAGGLVVAAVGTFCAGAGFAVYNVTVVTARQELIPEQWRGRADSLSRSVSWGILPLGSLLGGIVADAAGLRVPALLAAVAAATAAIWVTVVTLRVASGSTVILSESDSAS